MMVLGTKGRKLVCRNDGGRKGEVMRADFGCRLLRTIPKKLKTVALSKIISLAFPPSNLPTKKIKL